MQLMDILAERIYLNGDKVVISDQKSREASSKEAISTFVRRVPYSTNLRGADGTIVYSVFNYASSPETAKMLSSLKGNGPYEVNPSHIDAFLARAAASCDQLIRQHLKPEVLVYPKSSSGFIRRFVEKLVARNKGIEIMEDAFVKKVLNADDVEPLINRAHPDWEKFSSDHPDEVRKLRLSLGKQIRDHGGHLELKKLYKPHLKFVKNFIELENAYEAIEKIVDRRVLVVDDVLSSGATVIEMIRQLQELEPKFLAALTVFKRA